MDNNQKQRLIPIKKADGTIERITFEEFKKQQKQKMGGKMNDENNSQLSKVNPPEPKKIKPAPMVNVSQGSSKPKEEEISLLEESLDNVSSTASVVSDSRDLEIEKMMKKIKFIIREPERLKKIIQARLKDIRSVDETREKLVLPIEKGGAGLKEAEASEVMSLFSSGSADKKEVTTMSAPEKKADNPVKKATLDFFTEQRSMSGQVDDISSLIKMTHQPSSDQTHENSSLRPMVRDVIPMKKSGFGPVDEIQSYNLEDFRRLSAKPTEAAERFKQKFIILQEESYLIFIKALMAWRQSPLYISIMNKVSEALNNKKSLAQVLGPSDIKIEELEALLNMEKTLE